MEMFRFEYQTFSSFFSFKYDLLEISFALRMTSLMKKSKIFAW